VVLDNLGFSRMRPESFNHLAGSGR
jgi:hypothetical protein